MKKIPNNPKPTAIAKMSARWRSSLEDHVTALAWSPDGRWLAACAST